MYQAKSGVKKFSPLVGGGGGSPPKKKLFKMSWNTFWFWNFWDTIIFWGGGVRKVNGPTNKQASKQASKQADRQTSGHHSDQISRSALRDGATKNNVFKKKPYISREISGQKSSSRMVFVPTDIVLGGTQCVYVKRNSINEPKRFVAHFIYVHWPRCGSTRVVFISNFTKHSLNT